MRRMTLLLAALAGLQPLAAIAEPTFARMYKSQYGYVPSCNACHKDGGGTPPNEYGQSFKDAKMVLASFGQIEAIDSDGDGFPNGDEARARANPGSAKSTPAAPGDWLDTSNLIPREVQEIFAAAGIGVERTERDENTIYIPLNESNRPVGISIIQPAMFNDKPFFLLVATDGALNIRNVVPVNTKHVPEAKDSAIYAKLVGNPAKNLKAPQAVNTVDDAIVLGVKKATTIIRLRLSGGRN